MKNTVMYILYGANAFNSNYQYGITMEQFEIIFGAGHGIMGAISAVDAVSQMAEIC